MNIKEHYNKLYKKLIWKYIFSDRVYAKLYPKGYKPVCPYDTPKMHKIFLPGSTRFYLLPLW